MDKLQVTVYRFSYMGNLQVTGFLLWVTYRLQFTGSLVWVTYRLQILLCEPVCGLSDNGSSEIVSCQ